MFKSVLEWECLPACAPQNSYSEAMLQVQVAGSVVEIRRSFQNHTREDIRRHQADMRFSEKWIMV